jgi:adenosine deaminase
VTVNTDNMTVSGVTLSHELEKLDLTPEQAKQVSINAANAAFVDEDDRMLLLEQIGEIFA